MQLTSDEAKEILEDARKKTENDMWINHSLCVGNTAAKIAEALNETGTNMDVDKVRALGYIHDIGKMVGPYNKHIINGYNYMKEQGYDEEYCNICLIHSYLNNDVNCTGGGLPGSEEDEFLVDFIKMHPYTIEEKIINLCDLMCRNVVTTVDKRLIDIMIRRGTWSNTQYHIKEVYKLKTYFDNLLGFNLYDLFPEIKENL